MAIAKHESNPEPVTTYTVSVEWMPKEQYEDGSSGGECYAAINNDIDGLILEADSLEKMEHEMREVIPVLLELNYGMKPDEAGKISIRMLGTANPRGVTKYEISHPA